MEVSVTAALGHIQTFVHPQVIITDHESREDVFFIKAIRAKAAAIDKSVIELPTNAAENLMWITRLDSGSLAGMDRLDKVLFRSANRTISVAYNLCRPGYSCPAKVVGVSSTAAESY